MKCSKSALFHFVDVVCLALVFLFQNVMLNYILIFHNHTSFHAFLWFLGDFFGLVLFSFTVFLAHNYHAKLKKREQRIASRASYASGGAGRSCTPPGSDISDESGYVSNPNTIFGNAKLPLTHLAWLYYSLLLILKITILFKSEIAQNLKPEDVMGPQMLKFCIGLATIIFSLLVESHHNAIGEPLRNAYLNSVAFGVALEILDSTSFLSMLIPSEGHLSYPYALENCVIALASVNLVLPAITIYKLSASNFGRVYNVPLESLYKFLHLLLVNVPFLCIRIYLWSMFSTDTAIFMIKNIYAIIAFIRGVYPDMKLLKEILRQRVQLRSIPTTSQKSESPGPSAAVNGVPPLGSQMVYNNEIFVNHKNLKVSNGNHNFPSITIEENK